MSGSSARTCSRTNGGEWTRIGRRSHLDVHLGAVILGERSPDRFRRGLCPVGIDSLFRDAHDFDFGTVGGVQPKTPAHGILLAEQLVGEVFIDYGDSRGFRRIARIEGAPAKDLRLHQREEVLIHLVRERGRRIPGRARLRAFREILARRLSGAERNRGGHRYLAHTARLAEPVGQLLIEVTRPGFVVPLDVRIEGEEEGMIHAEARIDSPCGLKSADAVGRNRQEDDR